VSCIPCSRTVWSNFFTGKVLVRLATAKDIIRDGGMYYTDADNRCIVSPVSCRMAPEPHILLLLSDFHLYTFCTLQYIVQVCCLSEYKNVEGFQSEDSCSSGKDYPLNNYYCIDCRSVCSVFVASGYCGCWVPIPALRRHIRGKKSIRYRTGSTIPVPVL
jgi:hypothetical protein